MNRVVSAVKQSLPVLTSCIILSACFHGSDTRLKGIEIEETSEMVYQEPGLSRYPSPIELTFIRNTSEDLDQLVSLLPNETIEDNRWTRLYEQVLGIRIKYKWMAKGNLYHQKLGVAIASGDIPDIVKVNSQQLRQLYNSGKIQDLTAVYEEFSSPLTKQTMRQEGNAPFEAATIDGKLMAIPDNSSSIEGAEFIWIRTDWLKALHLQPPQSIDDVLRISKAFTERDPDQNGKKDTYGIAATSYLFDPVAGVTGFMAGYEAYPNLWIQDESGKLVFGGIQPNAKAALKSLQEMYLSGQIDSEFGIKEGIKVKKDVANGKIGMLYGQQWSPFWVQESRERNPDAEWQPYPIVSLTGGPPKVPLSFQTTQFFAVSKNCEHPEAIVKLINLHLEKNWGTTAEYNKYYSTPLPVWSLSPVTPFPVLKNVEAYRQLEEARLTGDFSSLKDEARSIQKNINTYMSREADQMSGWGWQLAYGPTGAFSILNQYEKNNQLLYESFVGGYTSTMIEKKAILDNLLNDTYLNIILGRPIDDFDRFVEEWKRAGGDQITDEVNQWYVTRGSQSR